MRRRGDAPGAGGGTWAEDGTIVFVPALGPGVSLWRVSSAGGKPEPLASPLRGEFNQTWPQVLPGGRGVLYTAPDRPGAVNDANLVVQPLPSGAPKVVQRGGYHGRYLPSGHLLYLHDGVLFAVPFDLDRLQSTGQATTVLDSMTSSMHYGQRTVCRVDRGHARVHARAKHRRGAAGRVDGSRREDHPVVGHPCELVQRSFRSRWTPARGGDFIRTKRPTSGSTTGTATRPTPLTRDPASELKAVWTPDGRRIAFNSNRDNSPHNLYWQRADGTGNAQRLTKSTNSQWPVSWHPSGKFLAFEEHKPGTNLDKDWDLMILPMEGDEVIGLETWNADRIPRQSVRGDAAELFAGRADGSRISRTKRDAMRCTCGLFVAPVTDGGYRPAAAPFPPGRAPNASCSSVSNGQIMVAAYAVEGDAFRAEKPRLLPNARYRAAGPARMFDLHPDGERFAVAPAAQAEEGAKRDKVAVILNFFDELRRVAPGTTR